MFRGVDSCSSDGIGADEEARDRCKALHAVARIRSVEGPATIHRPDGSTARATTEGLLHPGDVVETGACGTVSIIFRDGTAFELSAEGRLALDDFCCDADGTLQSGLIKLFKGTFAFVAGTLARAGKLRIDTPLAAMRGPVPFGGMGIVSFAAFTFALLKEVQAADPDIAILAEGQGQLSDMEYGPVEVVTKGPNPQVIVIDNPEVSYIISPQGSGVSVSSVVNSAQQIADYLSASKDAFQSYVTGRADPFVQQQRADLGATPTAAGGGGSGTLFSDPIPVTTGVTAPAVQPPPNPTPPPAPASGPAPGTTFVFVDPPLPPPPVDTTPTEATPFTVVEAGVRLGGDDPAPGAPITSGTLGVTVIAVNGDASNVGQLVTGIYGTITIKSDGSYKYTLDNTDPDTNALPAGSAAPDTFTVTLSNNVIEPLIITVFGNNDIPLAVADNAAVIEAGVNPGNTLFAGTPTVTGNVLTNDTDPDTGHVLHVAAVVGHTGAVGVAVAGTYGSVTIQADGSYVYTLNNADPDTEALAQGQTATEVFQYTVSDEHGAISSENLTVTVTGTNDIPVIISGLANHQGGVTEDANPVTLSTGGTIMFRDVDLIDTHTASFVLKSTDATVNLPGFTDGNNGSETRIGTFAIDSAVTENPADTNNTGTLGWSFTLPDNDPVLQSLAKDQTITQVYTVTITDNNGASVSQDITVTITGVNDGPVIISGAANHQGGVTEDANPVTLSTGGTIMFRDVDLIDTHTASFVLKSTDATVNLPGFTDGNNGSETRIGTFAIDSAVTENPADTNNTGTLGWSFTLDDNNTVLQSLAKDQTITQVYTVTITDNNGAPVSQDITVTITGVNDGPVIISGAANHQGGVTEDANPVTLSTGGTIMFRDVDLIDTHTASFVLKSTDATVNLPGFTDGNNGSETRIGTFAIDSAVTENPADTNNTGTLGWSFTLDDNNTVLQSLAKDQTITQVYTVTITDNNGAPVSQDITVTITGVNDGPVIISGAANHQGGVTEDANPVTLSTGGTIMFRDVDLIDTHTASFVLKSTDATVNLPGFTDGNNGSETRIGTFAIDSAVTENPADTNNTGTLGWSFTLDDNNTVLQSLAKDQTITQVYTVTITDNNGAPVSQDITVTITGVNDGPVIISGAANHQGGVTEDANPVTLSTGGTIMFRDVDLIDTHTASFVLKSTDANANLPGFTDGNNGSETRIGTFAIDSAVTENPADTNNTGTLGWSFTLDDNNTVLQSLAKDQTITQVYTVTITDNNGASVPQDITVTITGVNDGPVIISGAANHQGGVTEDANPVTLSTGGTIMFRDVDLIDTHTASFVLKSTDATVNLPGFTDGNNGSETRIGTFAIDSAVTENPADTNNTGTLGWSFTLDDNNTVLQSLAKDQTITQVYTVTITDNNGAPVSQDITVTITGVNDGPVIISGAANHQGGVTEDANPVTLSTGGTIMFRDVDLIDTHTASFVLKSTDATVNLPGFTDGNNGSETRIGTFAIDSAVTENPADTNNTGTLGWSFTLDDNNTVLQSLAKDQTITQVYTVTITDNNGAPVSQDITVTITGVNDGPVIISGAANHQGGVTEDANPVTLSTGGTIMFRDVDLIDTHTASFVLKSTDANANLPGFTDGNNGSETRIGTFAIDSAVTENPADTNNTGTLSWSFTLDDNNTVLQSLAEGQTITQIYTVTVEDNNHATVTQDVTVTITGTNDAPVISVLSGDTDTKTISGTGSPLTSSGSLTVNDIDLIDTVTGSVSNVQLSGTTNGLSSSDVIGMLSLTPGSMTADPGETHNLTWHFDSGSQVFGFLGGGQSLTLDYTVLVSDGHSGTDEQTVTVTITAPPITVDLNGAASGTNNTISYPSIVTPMPIAPAATIIGATTLASMTVTLTNPVDNSSGTGGVNIKEFLSLSAAAQQLATTDGLTVTFTANGSNPETLVIQGVASTGDYQTILDGVQYADTHTGTHKTTPRIVDVVVNDGTHDSNVATVTINVAAPAGVAGAPINLALVDPATAADTPITVTFTDLPAGWTLNGGTDLGNGTWAVQTHDVSALTVTTPADYTGAFLLHATESWINPDNVAVSAIFGDNVEAYAPGSPIFAWSGSDTLTGAGANDLFVFAGPISNDDIYNFSSASDKIDLIGFGGISSFADLHIADNSVGEATIDLGNEQTITLHGVDAVSLTSSDFLFDQTPTTDNAGSMVISDGAMMPFSGDINNTGSIELGSAGHGALLQLIQYGVTLHGDGQIVLSDDDGNVISGTSQGVTLNNVDNTISGAGELGAGELDLINSGTIIATGSHSLIIDTGANVIENFGVLESTGSGGLMVNSSIDNGGQILAHGGDITLNGAVSGSGSVVVDGAATVTFGAAASVNTALAADAVATLVMRDSIDFSGKISGFDANDHLDLKDMTFANGVSLAYSANQDGTGGVLQVTDGAHSANIALLGQYDAAGFASTADGGAGTLISYDPAHHTA